MESKVNQESLLNVVSRLEAVVNKLESKNLIGSSNQVNLSSSMLSIENIAVFSDFWNKTLQNLLDLQKLAEENKKPEIEQLTNFLIEGLCFQQDLLIAAQTFKKPQSNEISDLSKKYFSITKKVDEFKKDKRDFALHCDAIKSGLESLCWMFNDDSCEAVVQTYAEAIEFPANKLFMQKIPEQTAWVKALKNVFKEVIALVNANYKKGINWALKGEEDLNKLMLTFGNTFRKNFKKLSDPDMPTIKQEEIREQIKEEITTGNPRKSLKKVQDQPIKEKEEPKPNENENQNQAKKEEPVKSSSSKPTKKGDPIRGRRETLMKKGPIEKFEQVRGTFFFENICDEVKELDVEKLAMKTIINFTNCYNCTFSVKKKVNAIKLTNCENVNVICDSLISIMEVINSENIKIQVDGVVNSFSIDGSKEVSFYLLPNSGHAQFIVSKSTDIRLRMRKEDDPSDYDETLIPEQFVFKYNDKQKLDCQISDLYNY
jgi:hypothetical protein